MTYPLALIMEKVSNLLSEAPNRMLLPFTIRQKFSIGRRSLLRVLKFGVHQGCLKVIHVPFGTACALVNRSDKDSVEISAEMLRKEADELSGIVTSLSFALPGCSGRRYVREAAVVYLHHPFDLKKYMVEAHINRGSRPDSVANIADNANLENSFMSEDTFIGDNDKLIPLDEDKDVFAYAPYYSPNVNFEESFCVQICRLLCEVDEKPNSQLAVHFNTSHKLISRYTDALAGIGKLLTSKVSAGTTFSLVRRYVTEKEALDLRNSLSGSKNACIPSVYNQRQMRKSFIIKILEELKVFPSVIDLRARIWANEESLGIKGKMDRKSLARIIDELVKEKRLKFINMEIVGRRYDGAARHVDLKMVCHPSIDSNSPELMECVLAEKKRSMIIPKPYGAIRPEDALNGVGQPEHSDETRLEGEIPHVQVITRKELELIRLPDKNISKLRRRCILHKFLFYLLYDQPPDSVPLTTNPQPWASIYNENSVMYRYIPPIPRNNSVREWITFHDVIQVMPLGLFLAVASPGTAPRLLLQWLSVLKGGEASLRLVFKNMISQQCEQARACSPYREEIAAPSSPVSSDALRRFELLRTPMASCPFPGGHGGSLYAWLMSRYNVTRIFSVVEELSSHGLLALNGQLIQDCLPMANIYVRKRAALLDTRFASPAHHIISDISACPPPFTYHFRTIEDVDTYWLNLRAILLFTPYGFTRFADPSISQFTDNKAPIHSLDRLQDVAELDDSPPTLPALNLTSLKTPTTTPLMIGDAEIHADASGQVKMLGVGGLHASLYLAKAPFEEMGYGTTEQGVCTQYKPSYPSPNLQLQPVVRVEELRAILKSFEPSLRTTGDGAFWPWTVQLFFDTDPAVELPPPPTLPAWLFSTRTRRFPFRIESSDPQPFTRHLSDNPRRRTQPKRRRRRRGGMTTRQSAPDSSATASSLEKSTTSDDDDEEEEEAESDSSFGELQPIFQSRKRRLQKRTAALHIHRNAFRRRRIMGDKRAMDERDVEIRNSLHYKRASWCKLEDQMLLACRVASLFLVGHTREYACIPYVIVRDLLQEYLPLESSDKTSLACARRLKFLLLLRNEERTRTDILLTKISSDPVLLAKYNIGKAAWVHLYNRDARQAHHLFKDLVRLIVRNFVPDLRNRCGETLDKSVLVAPSPMDVEAAGVQPRLFSVREILTVPRESLNERYDFILLTSTHSDQDLPDIGSSRPAIVVDALRNLFLGSIRLRAEPQLPHNTIAFNRILRQYPFEQMSEAVKCLSFLESVRKTKSYEDSDLNVSGQFRMKVTLRLYTWCNVHMFIYIRFFFEALDLQRKFSKEISASQLSSSSSSQTATGPDGDKVMEEDQVVAKHEFSDPTSGGLVATFFEALYTQWQMKLKITFDMSCISVLSKPCMSIEDRKAELLSNPETDCPPTPREPQRGSLAPLPFGESTHIGMTVALLEGRDFKNNDGTTVSGTSATTTTTIAESLMALLLEGASGGMDSGVKGKTPRIDIRLSLNGGSIEALVPRAHSNVSLITGQAEHQELCCRVVEKFMAPLNWDAAGARTATSEPPGLRTPETEPDLSIRLLNAIFNAGDLGCTFEHILHTFGDTVATCDGVSKLVDEQKIFLLGLSEPRYIHWAHLRLWLVHVKSTKIRHRSSADDFSVAAGDDEEEEGLVHAKRRRLSSAVSAAALDDLTNGTSPAQQTAFDVPGCGDRLNRTDYYFIPQPWISEVGTVKANFFTHLLQTICSMISRHSGAPMNVLASQSRHILSPVSFRILCHFLHDVQVIRISRVVYNTKCSIFSEPEPVLCLDDKILLSPARELTLALEPQFVSRMNTLFVCLCEKAFDGYTPEDPTPYIQFSNWRVPRYANVLQRQSTDPQDAPT